MRRKSVTPTIVSGLLTSRDQKRCRYIAIFILVQSSIICIGAYTVMGCMWSPSRSDLDFYKLTSIMYLYDKNHCVDTCPKTNPTVKALKIQNDTMGLPVVAIKQVPPEASVSTRLSADTRKYIEISLVGHIIWMVLVILFWIITCHNKSPEGLKFAIMTLYYVNVLVVPIDISMAIFYVSHIKQSLTKGMIVRYSGWSTELDLENPEDFAAWLPMLAAACWLRGIIFFGLNIFVIRILNFIRLKMQKREIIQRFAKRTNFPIPPPNPDSTLHVKVLYYRPGESKPSLAQRNSYN